MKRTNLFLICLMASIPAFSQVDTIADNIYEYNGNLGVGLSNPETLLHLIGEVPTGEARNLLRLQNADDGDLSFTGIKMLTGNSGGYSVIMDVGKNYSSTPSYNINGFLGIGNSANGVFLNAEGVTGMIRFFAGVNPSNGGWYERMRINHDGNIGIGTINPLSKLEVNGMIHSTSQGFKFPDGTIQTSAASGSDSSYWNSFNNHIYYNQGNVGIGLTNPQTSLHVVGQVSSGEERNLLRLHNTNDGNLSFTGIKMLTGNSGGYSVIMDVGKNYSSTPSYNINGFLGIGNSANGVFLNAEGATGMIRFFAGVNPSNGSWHERMRINYDGNIGIGTINPLSKLEVNGMIHSTSQGFKFPDGTIQTSAASGSGSSYWNSFNNHIYFNQGNVGIGTDEPGLKLHIRDTSSQLFLGYQSAYDGPYINLTGEVAGATPMLAMGLAQKDYDYNGKIIANADWAYIYGNNYNRGIAFLPDLAYAPDGLYVTRDGLVGIGTSNPDVRLRIEDNVDDGPDRALIRLKNLSTSNTSFVSLGLESNDSKFGMAMTLTSEQYTAIRDFDKMGVISVNGKGFSVYSTSDYGSIRFYTNMDQNGIIERMRINSEGNVGIGTKEPIAKVEIADGDIFISDINRGIIMKSPDGQCWRGTLDNSGNLVFINIDCPGAISFSIENRSDATNNAFSIYPNPVENTVTIASLIGHIKNASAFIYTMDGKMVRKDVLNTDVTILNINNIPSGSYIIRVINKRGEELGSETLVKE